MSYQIIFTDELYHHGIKGQKWGHRKYQNPDGSLTAAGKARYDVKEAKREYRRARKDFRKARGVLGLKSTFSPTKYSKAADALYTAREKKLNVLDKKAKRDSLKSDKKEFKRYVKAMDRTGRRGSVADYGGRSKELYDHIAKTKGKSYADKVEKKVGQKQVKRIVTSGAIAAGSAAAALYLKKKNGL